MYIVIGVPSNLYIGGRIPSVPKGLTPLRCSNNLPFLASSGFWGAIQGGQSFRWDLFFRERVAFLNWGKEWRRWRGNGGELSIPNKISTVPHFTPVALLVSSKFNSQSSIPYLIRGQCITVGLKLCNLLTCLLKRHRHSNHNKPTFTDNSAW